MLSSSCGMPFGKRGGLFPGVWSFRRPYFRPLQVEAIGGARVLGATHAPNEVERTGIGAAFFEDIVLQVNADDLPDHQASARRLGPKINDPVELALEADWRLRHLWRAHELRRPRGQFRQREFVY